MNKTEASEFLGIGVRTLERYMTQNRVAFTRQRGKTGETVVFERSELEHFKQELYAPIHEGAVQVRQGSPSNSSELVTNSQLLAEIGESLTNLIPRIESILEIMERDTQPGVPLHLKPLLTLPEAQKLSGLSRQYLIQAIRENRLKALKIGKAWRVKRRDLERFVSKLF